MKWYNLTGLVAALLLVLCVSIVILTWYAEGDVSAACIVVSIPMLCSCLLIAWCVQCARDEEGRDDE